MKRMGRRILEIIPGFLSWNLILFPIWGGYVVPEFTAYFILTFVVYALYRSFGLLVSLLLAHYRILAYKKTDWVKEISSLEDNRRVTHVFLLMIANEPFEVYEKTIESLSHQTLNRSQIIPVLATEERFPSGKEGALKLKNKYKKVFGDIIITVHPKDIPGEIKGKSSNENWACREAKRILVDEGNYDIDYITVTSNDADAIVDKQYFACLTYEFLTEKNRYERFWQPAIVFYKNIWKLPMATRVVNTLSGIMNLGSLPRKDRLTVFSNYSASLKMIDKIGYWDTDVIPEDYRIFFKAFFCLGGRVEVNPIYLPSLGDSPEGVNFWKTVVNDYQQKKRWAWGVSDLPTFVVMFAKNWKGNTTNKLLRLARVWEHHILWPVNWFILTIGSWGASLLNPDFSRTAIGFLLPQTTSLLMTISLGFLLIMLLVDMAQRPPRPGDVPKWRSFLVPFEFALMPVVGFFFSALPGIDAHTRLLLGKYMEYRITEKISDKK